MVSRVPMGVRDTGQMAMHMARQATRRVYLSFPIFLETSGGRRVCKYEDEMTFGCWPFFHGLATLLWLYPFVVNHVIEQNPPIVQYYGPHYGQVLRFLRWEIFLPYDFCSFFIFDVWTCLEFLFLWFPYFFSAQTAFLDILKTSICPFLDISRHRFTEPRIGQEPHWNSNTSCATDTFEHFSLSIWGESTSSKWTGTASCCFKSLIWCLDEFWYHFLCKVSKNFCNHLGNNFFCTKYAEVFWHTFKPKSAQLRKYGTICAVNGTRVSFFFFSEHLTWAAGVLTQDFEQFIQLQSEVGKLPNTISQNKRNRSCTCQSSILSSIWPCVKRRLVAM